MTRISRRAFLHSSGPLVAGAALTGLALPDLSHAQSVALTMEQALVLQDINVYFNQIRTMNGDFVQFDHIGRRSEGSFNLSRPGKLRFSYEPPARLDVVADGNSVAIIDRKLQTQDIYPLGRTPLRFLVSDYINLTRDAKVQGVRVEPDIVTILIEGKKRTDGGQIQLMFDAETHDLRQWIVTDNQGRATTVALYNVALDQPQDDALFKIQYRRPREPNRKD